MARRKKKRAYGRRRGFRLLYQLLSAVLIVAAVVGGSILFFRVEEVQVAFFRGEEPLTEGGGKYSAEQILAAAAVEEHANLLLLPERAIERRLKEGFPYVDEVTVKRLFPTGVRLEIRECLPLVIVQSEGAFWVLDAKGKVLERMEENLTGDYIQVAGLTLIEPQVGAYAQVEAEAEPMFQALKGILGALEARGLYGDVAWIDITSRTEVDMDYLDRFTVRLPVNMEYGDEAKHNAEYLRKMEILDKMVTKLDASDRGTIDLRGQGVYLSPL